MEQAAVVDAPAAPAAPAAAPAPAAPEVAGGTASPDKPEAQQPERTFSQKELDEILEKRLGKERRKREEIERRLRITEELHLKGRDGQQPAQRQDELQVGKEPKREEFDTYEQFIEARAEWRAEQAAERRITEREKKAQESAAKEQAAKEAEAFRKRMKDSAKGLEDYDDVMAEATRDASQPVSRIFADALDGLEAPARVLYELARNQDEAERIASLPLARQARELTLLDMKLKQQPQPQRSRAPSPIDPVGGKGGAASDEITGNESGDEYLRKRNAQLRKAAAR